MARSRSPVAFGQYIITRRIARGGMAEIYRARSRNTGEAPPRWVAVKMMRPSMGHEELREHLFKREARIASAINHPNVIPLFEFGLEMERYYISMEYVRGRDLSHLLKNEKKGRELLPFELGLYIGLEAAAGLGHAHRLLDEGGEPLGIVHRDISPGNVMVGYDGVVKVLDFGVARMNESEGMRTQTGTLRGKFAYMSPEQTLGEALDARSDVFSLGTVLYELLTGANCFRAENPIATLERVQRVRPVPPSRANREIPKSVDRILARCLAKDRKRRFQDCAVLREALGEFLDKRNFSGKEILARHMCDRFEWEKAEEEKELTREEEEVALFDVIDFALVGEDVGLDAPHVAVSQQEEASQSEVNKAALTKGSNVEEDQVFDSDDNEEHSATEAGGRQQSPARPKLPPPVDPDSELELTVAHPRRFEDPEEIHEGRRVELSSLLDHGAADEPEPETPGRLPTARPASSRAPSQKLPRGTMSSRPPTAAEVAALDPQPTTRIPTPMPKKDEHAGQVLFGMRAPEFSGILGHAGVADDREAPQSTQIATVALGAKQWRPRMGMVIGGLVGSVLIVAVFVAMGMESKSESHAAPLPANANAKRTTIAPVTITLEETAAIEREKAAKAEAEREKAEAEKPATPEAELPAGDADAEAAEVEQAQEEERAQRAKVKEREREPPRRAPIAAAAQLAAAQQKERERAQPVKKVAALVPRVEKALAKAPPRGKQIGYLNVGAKPWAEITINGSKWPYQTPQAGIELPVGRHTITLFNRELGSTKTQVVQIKQGEYTTISVDMKKK